MKTPEHGHNETDGAKKPSDNKVNVPTPAGSKAADSSTIPTAEANDDNDRTRSRRSDEKSNESAG